MTIVGRAIASLERRSANPALPFGDSTPPAPGMLRSATAGINVTQQATFGIAAVYGAVGILADAVATLPIRVLDSPNLSTANLLAPTALIQQPYVELSRIDWLVQFVSSLSLRGNFYGQILERDTQLYASQIKPVPVDSASVRRDTNGRLEYRFFGQPIPIDDVFHVKNTSMPGMLKGIDPIEVLSVTLGLALAQERYGESYFRNSATPSGVIEVEGSLDVDEAIAMAKAWLASHQGLNNANLPAVLTDGATFNPITITPEDSQFLESRQFSAQQIASLFRIPPHMLGLVDKTTSWGTGIEQQERGFVANTLQGYLSRAEESLTALHAPGQYVSFDIEQRVQGDTLQRAQAASLMMLAGAWTANDARARFRMPPLDEGDELYVPINTQLLDQALKELAQPEDPSSAPPEDGRSLVRIIEPGFTPEARVLELLERRFEQRALRVRGDELIAKMLEEEHVDDRDDRRVPPMPGSRQEAMLAAARDWDRHHAANPAAFDDPDK